MPVTVKVEHSGIDLFERFRVPSVPERLYALCEASAHKLLSMIMEDLEHRWSQLQVSSKVITKFPAFADLSSLLEKYTKCFRVEVTDIDASVVLDKEMLVSQGLPKELPDMLEYGDALGIPPIPHRRTAYNRFMSIEVERLAKQGIA